MSFSSVTDSTMSLNVITVTLNMGEYQQWKKQIIYSIKTQDCDMTVVQIKALQTKHWKNSDTAADQSLTPSITCQDHMSTTVLWIQLVSVNMTHQDTSAS